jgi:alpha-2-macroglobulin
VLDPAAGHAFNVYSVNYRRLKVSLYKVGPEDWPRFRSYEQQRYDNARDEKTANRLKPPGQLVSEKVVEVKAAPDEMIETAVDLSPALTNGHGQAFLSVVPVDDAGGPVRVYAYRPADGAVESWVEATDIGLDAFADKNSLVAWANSLKDGSPLQGVELSLLPDGLSAATSADGVARFAFDAHAATGGEPLLVARRGDDVSILPQSYQHESEGGASAWRHAGEQSALSWYVFDDRKLYRPRRARPQT